MVCAFDQKFVVSRLVWRFDVHLRLGQRSRGESIGRTYRLIPSYTIGAIRLLRKVRWPAASAASPHGTFQTFPGKSCSKQHKQLASFEKLHELQKSTCIFLQADGIPKRRHTYAQC